MQLNYRGIKYEANSPVINLNNSNPADATLQYRGNTYDTNLPVIAQTEAVAADATLQYRGNTLNAVVPMIAPVGVEVVVSPTTEVAPAPVSVAGDRARSLMMNHHRQVKQRQQVMLSRLASSIGLDASETSKYWNHIQGKVHPSFWATYDRSHVAAS